MPLSEASHSNSNGSVKSGKARTGGEVIVSLSFWKATSAAGVHKKSILHSHMIKWLADFAKAKHKFPVITCETKETSQFFHCSRLRPVHDSLNLGGISLDTFA
ncbi:hypothetical protein ACFX13_036198 [Malus domestica]